LVLAIEARRDLVVESKGVPCEPPAGLQRGGNPLEGAAAIGLSR
jgi:hypothetical protein